MQTEKPTLDLSEDTGQLSAAFFHSSTDIHPGYFAVYSPYFPCTFASINSAEFYGEFRSLEVSAADGPGSLTPRRPNYSAGSLSNVSAGISNQSLELRPIPVC